MPITDYLKVSTHNAGVMTHQVSARIHALWEAGREAQAKSLETLAKVSMREAWYAMSDDYDSTYWV